MSKNFLFKLLMALGILAAAVLWLLVALKVIEGFPWSWTVVAVAGIWGIAFLIKGIFYKNVVTFKRMNVLVGCILLAIAVIALIFALALVGEEMRTPQLIIAIIATAVAVALVLGVLVTGGKKWDQGDNQKVGYKNYYERKAEEEKKAKENEKKD